MKQSTTRSTKKKPWYNKYLLLIILFIFLVSILVFVIFIHENRYKFVYESAPTDVLFKQYFEYITELHSQKHRIENIKDLSVPDINALINANLKLVHKDEHIKKIINSLLEERFRLKCTGKRIIDFKYHNPYLYDACDYEFVYHFMNSKIKMGYKEELINNDELVSIVRSTYNHYKEYYSKVEYLDTNHNKWSKMINMAGWVNLLDKSEEEFWITKYSTIKINKNKSEFVQTWNRVWAFYGLGIMNIDDLQSIGSVDYKEAKRNICSYTPLISALKEEDFANEGMAAMLMKYISIMNFCNKKVRLIRPKECPYIMFLSCKKLMCCGMFDLQQISQF